MKAVKWIGGMIASLIGKTSNVKYLLIFVLTNILIACGGSGSDPAPAPEDPPIEEETEKVIKKKETVREFDFEVSADGQSAETLTVDEAIESRFVIGVNSLESFDQIEFSSSNAPDFFNLTSSEHGVAEITLSPDHSSAGTYVIQIDVEMDSESASIELTLSVSEVAAPLALNLAESASVIEGAGITVPISVNDASLRDVSFSLIAKPSFVSIQDKGNGQADLIINPSFSSAGSYNLVVAASEGEVSVEASMALSVEDKNRVPFFVFLEDKEMRNGAVLTTTIFARDLDGDSVEYDAVFPSFGELTTYNGKPALKFSPSYGDPGEYEIRVIANDGKDEIEDSFTLTVTDRNLRPKIEPIDRQVMQVNTEHEVVLSVLDNDLESLRYSMGDNPKDFASFKALPNNKVAVVLKPDSYDVGRHSIKLEVSDGYYSDIEYLYVDIQSDNYPPHAEQTYSSLRAQENGEDSRTLVFSDRDNDTLTYSYEGAPSFLTFEEIAYGELLITAKPGYTDAGTYRFTVTASDGELVDSTDVEVRISNNDRYTNFGIGNYNTYEGVKSELEFEAADPDLDDIISFAVIGELPSFITFKDNGDRSGVFDLQPGYSDGGVYEITVAMTNITNNHEYVRESTFEVTVNGVLSGEIKSLDSGEETVCAIDDFGVECWGWASFVSPISHGGVLEGVSTDIYADCALEDGKPVCFGYLRDEVPVFDEKIIQVATGYYHACALSETGKVSCWGNRSYVNVPEDLGPARQVVIGQGLTCALVEDDIHCWNANRLEAQSPIGGLVDVQTISAGLHHVCALDSAGVHCWGASADGDEYNDHGQWNVPSDLEDVSILSAGGWHTCVLDGTAVKCWGYNGDSNRLIPPENLTAVTKIAAGHRHTCLLDNNVVKCWGVDDSELVGSPYGPKELEN